jgi:hypothetical protein
MRASGRLLLGMQAAEHGMTNLPPSRPREALHLRHDARPDPLARPSRRARMASEQSRRRIAPRGAPGTGRDRTPHGRRSSGLRHHPRRASMTRGIVRARTTPSARDRYHILNSWRGETIRPLLILARSSAGEARASGLPARTRARGVIALPFETPARRRPGGRVGRDGAGRVGRGL